MNQTLIAEETTPEPEVGHVYEQDRGGLATIQILYVDSQIVVLRRDETRRSGDNAHRLERRASFDDRVQAGFYEYQPDSDVDMLDQQSEEDWTEVAYVGEAGNDSLHDAGFDTKLDVVQADDDDLLDVDNIGNTAATNLTEYVR